jgi:hypothetical protein
MHDRVNAQLVPFQFIVLVYQKMLRFFVRVLC